MQNLGQVSVQFNSQGGIAMDGPVVVMAAWPLFPSGTSPTLHPVRFSQTL